MTVLVPNVYSSSSTSSPIVVGAGICEDDDFVVNSRNAYSCAYSCFVSSLKNSRLLINACACRCRCMIKDDEDEYKHKDMFHICRFVLPRSCECTFPLDASMSFG